MKKEQDLIAQPNNIAADLPAITTTSSPFLISNSDELMAGGKVRSKYGFPKEEMIVIGFFSALLLDVFQNLNEHLTQEQISMIALKIIKNPQNLNEYGFVRGYDSTQFYQSLKPSPSNSYFSKYTNNKLYCLCKYYCLSTNSFKHIYFQAIELDFL